MEAARRQQAEAEANWSAAYGNAKSALYARLEVLAQADGDEDFSSKMALLATNLMIGEPADESIENELEQYLEAANLLAWKSMRDSPELRGLAVSAAHAYSLFWLMHGVDLETQEADDDSLGLAEHYVDHAIEWADSKALYLSTAAQINMSWRRYPHALELATAAVAAEPTNPEALRMMGVAAYANDDLVTAKRYLERALQIAPGLDGVEEPLRMIEAELGEH
jgi:tetratricopeptide (TPR) repeat protein